MQKGAEAEALAPLLCRRTMTEGCLEAPARRANAWDDPDFTGRTKTEAEMRWIWDICHTCRRCFNLCDAFPRLFDLIDSSATGEIDSVAVGDYHKVADACTLCDMCFMTKDPYVPPHEFNVDFPHVTRRYRAVELCEKKILGRQRELAKTDRNGRLAGLVAPLANWANNRRNGLTRPPLEKVFEIDRTSAGALSRPHLRQAVEAFGAAGRLLGTGRRPSGDPLRDLLRQLQQSAHWRGDPRGPLPQRGRNRSAVSSVLRHAATRAGQPRRDRQIGFRGCSDSRPPDMMSSR
jgi:hypothetical protein